MITFKKNPAGALVTAKRIGTFTVSFYQDEYGMYDILITQLMGPDQPPYTWYHGQTDLITDLNQAFQDPIGYAQENQ